MSIKKPLLASNAAGNSAGKEKAKPDTTDFDMKAFIKSEMKKMISTSQGTPISVNNYVLEYAGNAQHTTLTDHCNKVTSR